jgi:nucleoside triphosphatase
MAIEVVVGAIIFNANEEVLLCKSQKWGGRYVVPGGHVEVGETLEQALRREIMEETQLEVTNIKLVGVKEHIASEGSRHLLLFDYTCHTQQLEVILNDEAEDYLWISVENMFKLPLDDFTRLFFDAWRSSEGAAWQKILYNVSSEATAE